MIILLLVIVAWLTIPFFVAKLILKEGLSMYRHICQKEALLLFINNSEKEIPIKTTENLW